MKLKYILLLFILPFYLNASWFDSDYTHGKSQINAEALIKAVKLNQVAFIDTREAEEYQESHIPGAQNIPLRELGNLDVTELAKYKYVVPYCLKDFRGFEMAKSLRQQGLKNVVLMEPAGFNGWRKQGLPVVTANKSTEQALAELAKI